MWNTRFLFRKIIDCYSFPLGFCLPTVGVEFDAQVSAAHTPGEEAQRADGRTFRRRSRGRGVQDVRVPGDDVHGGHGIPESTGKCTFVQ